MTQRNFFNPDKLSLRLIVLVGICFLTFGSYFVYDIPGSLSSYLLEGLHIDNSKLGALYSVYSWPNTILALFGGFLIDRVFGIKLGAIVFCSLVFIGQLIFAIGVQAGNFWICLFGRFVFGLGGESLSVSQSTYAARWFTGKELALAFGITLSFSRVGSAVNFNMMPWLVGLVGLPIAIWISVLICLISMAFALELAFLDWKGQKFKEENGTMPPKSEEKVSITDVLFFPLPMWLLVFICVSFYVAVFIFVQFGSQFIQSKWQYTESQADRVVGIISIFSAVASPFLGFAVDKIGRSLIWVLTASSVLCGAHLFLDWVSVTPYVGLVIMGAAYSTCAAALWPCVALIIPPFRIATAYGLMTAIQNLGLAVAPLAVGAILVDTNNDFSLAQYIYAGCAAVAAGFTVLLIFVDIKQGVRLNASPKRLKEIRQI